jgi:hypothetical protein
MFLLETSATRKLYNKLWSELTNFCMVQLHEQDSHPPISISTLSLFLAYLFDKGYALFTMITYNSAISYVHKLNGTNCETKRVKFNIGK